jgi:hypothetical protein
MKYLGSLRLGRCQYRIFRYSSKHWSILYFPTPGRLEAANWLDDRPGPSKIESGERNIPAAIVRIPRNPNRPLADYRHFYF